MSVFEKDEESGTHIRPTHITNKTAIFFFQFSLRANIDGIGSPRIARSSIIHNIAADNTIG
jgi:hypothetical protein